MPNQVWICATCESQYQNREGAAECEGKHVIFDQIHLKAVLYTRSDHSYGSARDQWQRYPSEVLIEFKDRAGDYARYTFSGNGAFPARLMRKDKKGGD